MIAEVGDLQYLLKKEKAAEHGGEPSKEGL